MCSLGWHIVDCPPSTFSALGTEWRTGRALGDRVQRRDLQFSASCVPTSSGGGHFFVGHSDCSEVLLTLLRSEGRGDARAAQRHLRLRDLQGRCGAVAYSARATPWAVKPFVPRKRRHGFLFAGGVKALMRTETIPRQWMWRRFHTLGRWVEAGATPVGCCGGSLQ